MMHESRSWIVAGLTAALTILVACGGDSNGDRASAQKSTSGAIRETTPKYLQRREAFFGLTPSDVGLVGDTNLMGNAILGVMVETGFDAGVAATIGHADGETNIFSSTGSSGFLGFGGAIRVAAATKAMIGATEQAIKAMRPTDEYPMPGPLEVVVYAVTVKGVFWAASTMEELNRGTHFLCPVVAASRNVYAEVRRAYQEQTGAPKKP